jgi:hypothetical protein
MALRSESDGIRFQTYRLYVAIIGDKETPIGKTGFLSFWAKEAYKKLSDTGNVQYFMQDYIEELDNDITAVFTLLYHGLNLSFFIASGAFFSLRVRYDCGSYSVEDQGDAEALRGESTNRISTIRDTLFNRHYPPALRQFKSGDYHSDGSFLRNSWFNFYKEDDTSYRLSMTIGPGRLTSTKDKGYPARALYFAATERTIFGSVRLHAKLEHSGNSRIMYQERNMGHPYPAERFFANSKDGSAKRWDIRFKVIPLASDNASRTPVRLVSYHEGTTSPTKTDNENTFGIIWKLEATNDPK